LLTSVQRFVDVGASLQPVFVSVHMLLTSVQRLHIASQLICCL